MKKGSTVFLQLVIVFIGIGTLVAMLWEPLIEGRNIHSTVFDVYFKDPFLAYAYVSSILFFIVVISYLKRLYIYYPNKLYIK